MKRQPKSIWRAALVAGAALLFVCVASANALQSSVPAAPTPKPTTSSSAKKAGTKKRRTAKRVRGQAAPTPDRIREIQAALAKAGAYSGEPTGKMDAATVQALKDFQESAGLPATGKLDAHTLQRLGLGSETAGVAAPRKPPAKTTASPPSPR